MTLLAKIAVDRTSAFNIGVEKFVRQAPAAGRDDLRQVTKEASTLLTEIHQLLGSGDQRKIRQLKTAFENHGIPVAENIMSTKNNELQDAVKSGLTTKKVATDRKNAFEIGTEVFIEKTGMADDAAVEFRSLMNRGLQELADNPELAQQAIAE